MNKAFNFSKRKSFFKKALFQALIFFCLFPLNAGILIKPRACYIIHTPHFDLLFPKDVRELAVDLSGRVEALYDEAVQASASTSNTRCSIIISPDSDVLEASYSPFPYHRIILYYGGADGANQHCSNQIIEVLRHQIYLAITQTTKSHFNSVVQKIFGGADWYQPISLYSLPFSLLEGFTYDLEDKNGGGAFRDGYFLQCLSQAKYEGNFPSWFECSNKADVYPYTTLAVAAGSAFMAYLQNVYGYEKYMEFWKECGKFHGFRFTKGIFRKVYQTGLEAEWKKFEESIPLPSDLQQMEMLKKVDKEFFEKDWESLYRHLVSSPYGLVWYDQIKQEVDIYDKAYNMKVRQLLFVAQDIQDLSISSDGRFLIISYEHSIYRETVKRYVTKIYDLKRRTFLGSDYNLKEAAAVTLDDGSFGLAGVDFSTKIPQLKVIYCGEVNELLNSTLSDNDKLIFSKNFYKGTPFNVCNGGKGFVLCNVALGEETDIATVRLSDGNAQFFKLYDDEGNRLLVKGLREANYNSDRLYTFNFVDKEKNSFTRMGCFTVSEEGKIEKPGLQRYDFEGGVNTPVFYDGYLFYSSRKAHYDTLNYIEPKALALKAAIVKEAEENRTEQLFTENREAAGETSVLDQSFKLGRYHSIKYLINSSLAPFFPIKDIDMEKGAVRWPALGLVLVTGKDPFETTALTLSAGVGFFDFDYSTARNFNNIINPSVEDFSFTTGQNAIFAGLYENSATPIDIKAGAIYKCNTDGEYNFKWIAGTSWKIPMGMDFQTITMNIQTENCYSTRYYDPLQKKTYPDLYGFPDINNLYTYFNLSTFAEYTNVSTYQSSAFQKRGITAGLKLYSLWDYKKILENPTVVYYTDTTTAAANGEQTESQKVDFFSTLIANITQLNLSLWARIDIPYLNPLHTYNGWIVSCPSSIGLELFKKNGRALEAYGEVLLLGWEIHNGISPLYLYFSRAGIKGGYNICLNYDTNVINLPDMRNFATFGNMF